MLFRIDNQSKYHYQLAKLTIEKPYWLTKGQTSGKELDNNVWQGHSKQLQCSYFNVLFAWAPCCYTPTATMK
jgi:hypothetical protein